MAGSSNRENSETSKYDNDSTWREIMDPTVQLPPSTQDSSGSSSSSTPVPIDQPVPPSGQAPKRQNPPPLAAPPKKQNPQPPAAPPQRQNPQPPAAPPQTRKRVLRSNAAAVKALQSPGLSHITEDVSAPERSSAKPTPNGKAPAAAPKQKAPAKPTPTGKAPTGQQPVAPLKSPGLSQVTDDESSSSAAQGNKRQKAKKNDKIQLTDKDTKLLNIIDSYHDFGSGTRVKDKAIRHAVGNIIFNYIKKDNLSIDFNLLTTTTGTTLEHNIYKKYVEENDDIEMPDEILLHDGTKKISILKDIENNFCIPETDKAKIHIIDDRGSYTGCDTASGFRKFILSYASWFDNGGCNNKPVTYEILDGEIKMEHPNEMFYIKSISGGLDGVTATSNAKGKIELPNNTTAIEFNQSANDDDRPSVPKYASYMDKNSKTFLKAFKNITNYDNKIMFLMDLKRAGDGLQIKSAKTVVPAIAIPIFVTSDIIAATIAVNNNIRTVLTTKDPDIQGTNAHSLKYAQVLLPKFLGDSEKLAKMNKDALNNYIVKNASEWKAYGISELKLLDAIKTKLNEHITTLIKQTIINNHNTDALIKNVVEQIKETNSFKKRIRNYYKRTDIRINKDIERREKEGYSAPIPIRDTDLKPFREEFNNKATGLFAKIDEALQFSNDALLTQLKTHLDTYTRKIEKYKSESGSKILNQYLKYIVKLTNHYVQTKNLATLFNQIYKQLINICTVIEKNIASVTTTNNPYNSRANPQFLQTISPKNKVLCKNLIIAKYIEIIFVRNEDRYNEYIGDFDENHVIISPIGMVFMEFLLKNKDIRTTMKTTVTDDIITLHELREIDSSKLKYLVQFKSPNDGFVHEFVKKILDPPSKSQVPANVLSESNHNNFSEKIAASLITQDKPELQLFYERLLVQYVTYMEEPSIADTTIGGEKRHRSVEIVEKLKKLFRKASPSIEEPFKNYKFTSLSKFMKLPFGIKELIIKLSPQRDIILRAIFIQFYNSKTYEPTEIKKELAILQKCKILLSDTSITGGKAKPSNSKKTTVLFGKIQKPKMKMPIMNQIIQKMKKIHSEEAFVLFKEYMYFYPELIDPLMAIYMKYSKSPLPVYGLTEDIKLSTK